MNNRTIIFLGTKAVLTYMDLIADKYDDYFDKMEEDNLGGIFACVASPFALPLLWMGGSHTTIGLFGMGYYFKDLAPYFFY